MDSKELITDFKARMYDLICNTLFAHAEKELLTEDALLYISAIDDAVNELVDMVTER